MAIERLVKKGQKIIEAKRLLPGYEEQISPRGFWRTLGRELASEQKTNVTVESDDKIRIKVTESGGIGYKKTKIDEELEKHDINDYEIESERFGFRRKVVSIRWRPSRIQIKPDEELGIQQLIKEGVWTEEQAQSARDTLIYEAQQEDKQRRKLPGS